MGKFFPKIYDTFMQPLEVKEFKVIRKNIVQKIEGSVLEIGCGTGFNFPFYQVAEQVTATDLSSPMLKRAEIRAKQAHVPIKLEIASAERLPYDDQTFDNVVCTLVLCTVPNPDQVIQELIRVSKPGGRLYVFEHVKVENRILGGLQEIITPMWQHICDGCHLNRDTVSLLEKSGLRLVSKNYLFKKIFVTMVLEFL